jgi:hypothetical protein
MCLYFFDASLDEPSQGVRNRMIYKCVLTACVDHRDRIQTCPSLNQFYTPAAATNSKAYAQFDIEAALPT